MTPDEARPPAVGGDGLRGSDDGRRQVEGDDRSPTDADAGASVACVTCGAVAAGALPPGWSVQASERGRGLEHLCPTCTRTYARSIEARLAPEWW